MRVRVTGLLFLALSACGGTGSSLDGGRRFLSIGTAPPGGAFFVVGGALAEVLSQADSTRGWQVSAESTKGTQENIRRLARKELDLALANASITYFEDGIDNKNNPGNTSKKFKNFSFALN